jgi:hypothetical protein
MADMLYRIFVFLPSSSLLDLRLEDSQARHVSGRQDQMHCAAQELATIYSPLLAYFLPSEEEVYIYRISNSLFTLDMFNSSGWGRP